jgi:type IX secretion system PorP/SprF family membrane protein
MKQFILFSMLLLSTSSFRAQQDEQMSLYMYNPLYFNPAYAGTRDAVSALALGRFQWVNFKGAPASQWFSIHSPVMHKVLGVGGHFINDQIGERKRTSAYADISSGITLNKAGDKLTAGLSVGFDAMGYDFTNSKVIDQTDPYYGKVFSVTKPNVGAGLYYYGEKHYAGISIPRLFQNKTQVNTVVESITAKHIYFAGGYVFDLNSVLKLKPSALIKYTPKAPLSIDINASLLMYERLWTGLMYRYNEAIGINLVYNVKNVFQVGYVYDFPVNGLRTYQYGSHEILLQYDFQPKKSTYHSPRYF